MHGLWSFSVFLAAICLFDAVNCKPYAIPSPINPDENNFDGKNLPSKSYSSPSNRSLDHTSGCPTRNSHYNHSSKSHPDDKPGSSKSSTPQIWLDLHNQIRRRYKVKDLEWDQNLADFALTVAKTCNFVHTRNNPNGENLAAGEPDPKTVVQDWFNGTGEANAWDPKNIKNSHFTQLVWEATQKVGCAQNPCPKLRNTPWNLDGRTMYVCEYYPTGNVETQYLENVHAGKGGTTP